jgi:hypothetical protein
MPFEFKIWNQGNDGQTMGIRVRNVTELKRLTSACTEPDLSGRWTNLADYLQAARNATSEPPPFVRLVQVIWLSPQGYGAARNFTGRTFVVTYTGPMRAAGGFASQGYCTVDPQGYPLLRNLHRRPIRVEYIADPAQDVLVVLP